MNRIFTLILLLSSFCAISQHKVTVTPTSDFKTIHNGIVESTFVFNTDLTTQEIEQFTKWANNNVDVGTFTLVGNTLVTALEVEANDRNVYGKIFYLLGVDILEVMVNGQKKMLDKDEFFDHINL